MRETERRRGFNCSPPRSFFPQHIDRGDPACLLSRIGISDLLFPLQTFEAESASGASTSVLTPHGFYIADMETTPDEFQHLLINVDNGELSSLPKIRVRNLTKKSDAGVPILSNVSLDVPRGLVVGVIGPSGSGKSTLLRALNRLWEPPCGSVFLDGEDIIDLDVLKLRRRVGMLFQLPVLFEGTVAENVRFGPGLVGKKLTNDEVSKLLNLADLDSSFASKKGADLSVGQAQRVALARTLANEPEVLLLDEPTSALDPISTQNIEDAIVKLKKTRGLTTVIISHSVKQIQRIADLVCLVVNGEVVEVLKPDELSQAEHPMARTFLELSS
ncbi:ABC transporter I family member 17 isoform X2 [Nymphaea colorata]|uniref:ABC transporter I family member 17 isoform X2 n=2 Tax=Nymphaea colorata TaxID=210225 RepID=UPI00214E3D02|nr:ABC transporter I family member 17 isoform X2 [Nymphaea colorata]